MQAEENREEISVIIESQGTGEVTLVDDDAVPVDYYVASEDITETVITSSGDVVIPCTEDNALTGVQCPGVLEAVSSMLQEETTVCTSADTMVVPDAGQSPSVSLSAPTSLEKEDGKVVEVKVIPIEMLYDGTLWSQFDFTRSGDEEMFVSETESVPLTVSDGVTDVARQVEVTTRSDNMCLSIRDITKRERDRQKKRVLRANPVFREKEKQKAKERMQSRRMDPVYREQERQRDRERRQLARRRNHTLRERERERDKEYKKHFRYGNRTSTSGTSVTDSSKSLDSFPCQVYLNTHYSTESS